MIELKIHSYGYSELIFHVLQGLAMFRQSDFYPAVLNSMILLVGAFYAIQMAHAKADGLWRQYLLKCFGMIIFANSLLLPKTSMVIEDHVEKSYWKVDNIPLAFSLPVGAIEQFGYILTMGFEQVFSLVGSRSALSYYHYGTVFGARLGKEVMQAKIRDPEVVGNMRNFIKRCVILPAAIGHKFSKEELVATANIWGFISKNAGDVTRTDMVVNGSRVHPSPTCKEAVSYFERKFASLNEGFINILSNKFRGAGETAKYNPGARQLNKSVSLAIAGIYGGGYQVDDILKHNMMINAINDYRSGKYATARAQMHQEAGGLLSGDLAEKTLTGSLAIMKVIAYSSFVFLLPLLILSGGFNKYKSWMTMIFSLALWPPLFSILNMVIDFAYDPAKIVSYSSWSTEMKKFDSIASLAAGLTISIPFLAYYMTRLGEGGLTQLAGTIMASTNAATSAIAGERASGSRNWDNDHIGNSSLENSSGFKTNLNMEYVRGQNGWALADGTSATITQDGHVVLSGGAGRTSSSGEASYHIEDGVQDVLREGLNMQKSLASSDSRSYSATKAKTISQQAVMLESIADHTRTSSGYNIDTSTEEGRTVNAALNEIDALNKTNNYGWRQNAETVLGAHAKAGFEASGFGFSAGGNVTADGTVSASNSSDQNNSDAKTINNEHGTHRSYNNLSRALNNEAWTREKGVSKDLSNSLHESYEQSQRLESQLAQRYEDIDTYNKALDHSKNAGSSSGKDMYQEVLETYAAESGKSIFDARRDVEARTPAVRRVFNRLAAAEADQILHQVRGTLDSGRAAIAAGGVERLEAASEDYGSRLDSRVGGYAQQEASRQRLDAAEVRQDVAAREVANKGYYYDMQDRVDDKYDSVHGSNSAKQTEIRQEVEQNEKDRMGNGLAARTAAGAMGLVTDGKAGHSIGRPPESYNDLKNILPEWKQYTGETPANTVHQKAERSSK